MRRGGLLAGSLVAAALVGGLGALVFLRRPEAPARPAAPPRQQPAAPPLDVSGRTPAETAAITAVAVRGLRVAGPEDLVQTPARDDLESLYGSYDPYFVRGDLNGDGILDFAQAFVRREGDDPPFDVAVFFGNPGGGFQRPVWVELGTPLSTGDLTIDRSILVLTPDIEADTARRYRWSPDQKSFVVVGDEPDDDSSGDEAPSTSDVPSDRA